MKNPRLLILLLLVIQTSCIDKSDKFNALDDYFENIPVDKEPVLFFPENFYNDTNYRDITFLPDYKEFYYTSLSKDTVIKMTGFVSGQWTNPVTAKFSGLYCDFEPAISPTGEELYFTSKRPSSGKQKTGNDIDIWRVMRNKEGWSEPVILNSSINTNGMEYYPSVTQNGRLYFGRNDLKITRGDIYSASHINKYYLNPEKLPQTINLPTTSFNAFISPDENYIIFSSYIQENNNWHSDLFISYIDKNGNWETPINLGEHINSEGNEISPWVSYDKKFLFFSSTKLDTSNVKYKIFWIATSAIPNFKNQEQNLE